MISSDRFEHNNTVTFDLSKSVDMINNDIQTFLRDKDISNINEFDDKLLSYCIDNEYV